MRQVSHEEKEFTHSHPVYIATSTVSASLTPHWHTFGEMIYFMGDHFVYSVKGKDYRLKKGDLLFLWPCEAHTSLQTGDSPVLLIQFSWNTFATSPEMNLLLNYLRKLQYLPCSGHEALFDKLLPLFEELRQIQEASSAFTDTRFHLALVQIFLAIYDELTSMDNAGQSEGHFRNSDMLQRLIRTCEYLSENCAKQISLEQAAEYAGVSKYHFSRIFREYTDTTFSEYLTAQRVRRAATLLEDPELSISSVAFLAGFGSLASFNRAFRRLQNCTPTEYRNILLREILTSPDSFQLPLKNS